MNKNEAIEQGLIEQYVLGELAHPLKEELESLLEQDHELKEYLKEVELGLKKLALENAVVPPSIVKTNILKTVSEQENDNVLQIPNTTEKKKSNWPLGLAAGISLLFMISSFWFYNNWRVSQAKLTALSKELSQMQEKLSEANSSINETNKWYQAISKPNASKLVLKGNELSPLSRAVTYINHQDKEVIFDAAGLAELPADKTYQVWADVEGVMINMGVVPAGAGMIALNYIEHAESVNLTIEPAGGSEHPTVEKLIANYYL